MRTVDAPTGCVLLAQSDYSGVWRYLLNRTKAEVHALSFLFQKQVSPALRTSGQHCQIYVYKKRGFHYTIESKRNFYT